MADLSGAEPQGVGGRAAEGGAQRVRGRVRPEVVRYSLDDTSSRLVHLRPTDLVNEMERGALQFGAAPVVGRAATVRMVLRLFGWVLRAVLRKLTAGYDPRVAATELRQMFEDFGGLWVKMGQLISLRSDILSREFCAEMDKLQYRAIGFPPEQSVALVEREIGMPVGEAFESFDAVPFAAASISQVHIARLRKGGVDVVVKVLRPGVRQVFERDFKVLRFLVRLANISPKLRLIELGSAVNRLAQIIEEETDFRYEASHMRKMRKLVREQGILVPRVYRHLSSANVLVSECIWGVLMSDYIRIKQADPGRAAAWCEINDVDPVEVGERLFLSFLRQLMEENFFHGDMHPGNIILLRNGRVALIDLGSVGTVDREFLTIYRAMLRALGQKDFTKAVDLQLRLTPNLKHRGLQELRQELVRHYKTWSGRAGIDSLPYNERNVLASSNEAGRIMFKYGVTQSWDLLEVGRTWATLDASLNELVPRMNYLAMFKMYFNDASRRGLRRALSFEGLRDGVTGPILMLQEYNMMLSPLLRKRVLAIQATASKLSRVGAIFARLLQLGTAAGLVVLIYNFFAQHHLASSLRGGVLDHLVVEELPELNRFWWVVVIGVGMMLLWSFRRMRQELQARDE